MLKYAIALTAILPTMAESQEIEVYMSCVTFFEILDGKIPTEPSTVGYIEGYWVGVTTTANTTPIIADRRMRAACEDDPSMTARQAVLQIEK